MAKFFRAPFSSEDGNPNRLQKYIQSASVKDMSKLAEDINPDVKQMIGMNVQALLGYLPSNDFNTSIMTSKESLQNLLASAMLTGYFVHTMEQRMVLDELFSTTSDEVNETDSELDTDELDSDEIELLPLDDGETESSEDNPTVSSSALDELLKSPEDLFKHFKEKMSKEKSSPRPELASLEALEKKGQFVTPEELFEKLAKPSKAHDLNIQLEINTQMDKLDLKDLTTLIKEIKSLKESFEQSKSEPEDEV